MTDGSQWLCAVTIDLGNVFAGFGAGGHARTEDLTITNCLRYQLRHTG